MLEDYELSGEMRYTCHTLVLNDDIRLQGVLAAAVLSALLVDTEEGDARQIAIDTEDERKAWFVRYEREVRRDGWGLLSVELDLLRNAYIELAGSDKTLTALCPNPRLRDLMFRLVDEYMQFLTIEMFGEHIWNTEPWQAPFAQWLFNAAQMETRRQLFLQTDWCDIPLVVGLADRYEKPSESETPTLFFDGEQANDIMERYFTWLWQLFTEQVQAFPNQKATSGANKSYLLEQETDWQFLENDIAEWSGHDQALWNEWMDAWKTFVTRRLKPAKEIRFWEKGISEKTQDQLIDYLRAQETRPLHYKCLAVAVYTLRQLGYIRRKCTFNDMAKYLTDHLTNDYTAQNNLYQFRRAFNDLGRYSSEIIDEVELLSSHGINKFGH